MSSSIDIVGNLVRVEFTSSVMPVFIEKKNKDHVYWGENNDYPAFLLDLYRRHPEHNAIIKAKAKYIYGKGLNINQENVNTIELAKGQSFLATANRFEDWNSVFEKTIKPLEIFNGFAWQIIWSLGGTKVEVYCLQASKCRVSPCGKKVYYANKWTDSKGKALSDSDLLKHGYKEFDAFNPDVRVGTQIYLYKVSEQTMEEYGDVYPIPEYCGAIINIATDVAVSDFQNCLVENGMTAQGMLTLFNGVPTPEEMKKHQKLFDNKFTGPNGRKVILNFANGDNEKGAEWTTFQTSDLDKQFELISKTNQQKIITGHQVTNKSLVGISVEGALSDRTAIIDSFEQMYNTYVEPRQQLILSEIKMIAGLVGVNLDHLEVQRLAPLGVDITANHLLPFFTEDEVREKLGYKPKEVKVDPAVVQAQVNENLQGLTGKDWIHIKRLVREVTNGKTTRQAAAMMIRNAYGLSDQDIDVLFGDSAPVIMASVDKFISAREFELQEVISLFESYAIDDNTEDEFISEEVFKMGEPSLEMKVLDILRGAPDTIPEKIARLLGVDSELIKTTIEGLIEKDLLAKQAGKLVPTESGNNKNIPPVETEIYTVYRYSLRDGVPALVGGRSREFCSKMMELSRAGKVFTREALDKLSVELGRNAWIYRGGYYNNPKTKETEPYCRHVWKAVTRSRTKRK